MASPTAGPRTHDRLFGGGAEDRSLSRPPVSPSAARGGSPSPLSGGFGIDVNRGRRMVSPRTNLGNSMAQCLSPGRATSPGAATLTSTKTSEGIVGMPRRGGPRAGGYSPTQITSCSFPMTSPSTRAARSVSPMTVGQHSGDGQTERIVDYNKRGQPAGGSPRSSVFTSPSPRREPRKPSTTPFPNGFEIDTHPGAVRCYPKTNATSPTLRPSSPGARGREDDVEGFVAAKQGTPAWAGIALGRRRAAPPSAGRSQLLSSVPPEEKTPTHDALQHCGLRGSPTFGTLQGMRERRHTQGPNTTEVLVGGPTTSVSPARPMRRQSPVRSAAYVEAKAPFGQSEDASTAASDGSFERVSKDEYPAAAPVVPRLAPPSFIPAPRATVGGHSDPESKLTRAIRSAGPPGSGGAPRPRPSVGSTISPKNSVSTAYSMASVSVTAASPKKWR